MKTVVFLIGFCALSLGITSIVLAGLPHPTGGTDQQARCLTDFNRCIATALNCPSCTERDIDVNVEACGRIYNDCIGL